MRDRIEAAIKDTYYSARDNGGTMHTAATDATDAVLAVLAAPDEATVERLREYVNEQHRTHQNDETGDVFCGCGYVYGDGQTHGLRAVLEGLAALGAPEQTGPDGGQGEAVSFGG